jgi:hypothetical protein
VLEVLQDRAPRRRPPRQPGVGGGQGEQK